MNLQSKTKVLTPRPYLSWSQLSLFEQSPEKYKKVYLYGERMTSKAMDLGSRVAKMMEDGEGAEDEGMEMLRVFFPTYQSREHELRAEIDGIPILGILDGFNEQPLTLGEYKTGVNWTQALVDKSGQLTFYNLLIYLNYKKLPDKTVLHWAPTKKDEDGTPQLTGEIITFLTQRQLSDVMAMIPRIKRAWAGIQAMCKKEQKKVGFI